MAAAPSLRCPAHPPVSAAPAYKGCNEANSFNTQSNRHYYQQPYSSGVEFKDRLGSFKRVKSVSGGQKTILSPSQQVLDSRCSMLGTCLWNLEVLQTPCGRDAFASDMPGLRTCTPNTQTFLPSTAPCCTLQQCKSWRSPVVGVLGTGALFAGHVRGSSTRVGSAKFSSARVCDAGVNVAGVSGARVFDTRDSGARVSGAAFLHSDVHQRRVVVKATRRSVTFKDPIEVGSGSSVARRRHEGTELENGAVYSEGESVSGQGAILDTDTSAEGRRADANGAGVSEAPKRRRRAAAAGDEGRVKRAYVQRKKVGEGAEKENGAVASDERTRGGDLGAGAGEDGANGLNRVSGVNGPSGETGVSGVNGPSGVNVAIAVNGANSSAESFDAVGATGCSAGVSLETPSVNGVEESVNGLAKPVKRRGRRKAAETVSENGSGASSLPAEAETSGLDSGSESDGFFGDSAYDGSVNGLAGGVNGRKRPAARRRRKAADLEDEHAEVAKAVRKAGANVFSDTDSDGAESSNADADVSGADASGQKRPVARRRRKTKSVDTDSESGLESDEIGVRRGVVDADESDGDVTGSSVNGSSVNGREGETATGENGRAKPVRRKRRSAKADAVSGSEDGAFREGVNGSLSDGRPSVTSDDTSTGLQEGFSEAVARSAPNGYPVRYFDQEGSSDGEFSDGGFSDGGFVDSESANGIASAGDSLNGVSMDGDSLDSVSTSGRKTVTGRRKSTARGPRAKRRYETDEESEPPETVTGYPLPAPPVFEPAPRRILDAPTVPAKKPPKGKAKAGRSSAGFVKEKLSQGLAMVSGNAGTDGEIDNSIDPHRLVRGELVVHKKVGIGRFRELRNESVEGRAAPVLFVYLEYADGLAKLPAHQAHRLLYRYRSPGIEGKEPALSKLKDRRAWERRKSKGRAHIQKMVINILKLYRLRAAVTRPPYPPDGEAQARFEATFTYQPTEHQQQAFDAVREDMCNKTVPMDRIVCGDVGFGKTEVALRAIFRAANAGRQVAVLAPTTVLAKQHYDVVVDRFKAFPEIEIAMLSRLAGEKEKKIGLERMSKGLVHVAVGTHALLGENVQFKDLGLLVVDEEQRFGVRQKERMKDMKTEIDVLTLSATPIPRTLEQATRGLKDLSLITTPPPSRRPIKTHLQQYDDQLVQWAIERELERGGQVFYIVPRIYGGKNANARSITDVKDDLKKTMPDVTVDMAHGQMSGPELERSMRAFRDGKTQILLCTSIVESGLDIPNCNTIIITEVEKFGLAQIYQLRGRVGRSSIEAHAYLLYSVENREELNPAAELRLQALEECVDLGAGVHVAQRDLTIRGTGEVFGEKQSGKLSSEIGADLFNEMLFDSLYRAQTETLPKVDYDDVKVDFVVDTLVPHDYIDCTEGRDQFLEDMEKAARGGVDSANEFYLEMEERLGPPPPGAKRRLQMLVMKQLAAALGITRIRTRPKFVLFETSMSIGAFQMLFDAIDEERAVDIKNNLIYKEGSAGFLLKSLLGLPPEKEAQDAFECLLEMSKGLDSFMNLERSSES